MTLSKSILFFRLPLPPVIRLQVRYVDLCKIVGWNYCHKSSIRLFRKEDILAPFKSLESDCCLRIRPHHHLRTMCSDSHHIGPSSQFRSTKEQITGKTRHSKMQMAVHLVHKFVRVFVKFVGMLFLLIVIIVVALPSFLSTKAGLAATIFLANHAIAGKLSLEKASLGWTKPVQLRGVSLENNEGEKVLSVPDLQTKASLWQIITGRSGFGDCTVVSPFIDLKDDQRTGISRLAHAVFPSHKLLKLKSRPPRSDMKMKRIEPAKTVSLMLNVKALNGNLDIIDGHISFPGDLAAVLGDRLFVDILIGKRAMADNEDICKILNTKFGVSPIQAKLWSDCAHAELIGLLDLKTKQINLLAPVKMEMDLTPAVGRLYLSRINPLLGDIMGPVVQDDDMPDVILQIIPQNMVLPAQQHKIKTEPMQMVLARQPLVDGVLSLLSKGDMLKGKTEIKLETSTFEVDLEVDKCLKCSRIDLLLADRVHLATWGQVDLTDETIQMMLAIPGTTLKEVLGFSKLPLDYYLQIPLRGTLDQPKVDFKQAGLSIAQLALYQRAGRYMEHIMEELLLSAEPPPKPMGTFPWTTARK